MILLHSLLAYSTVFIALLTFGLYMLSLTVLKNTQAFRYALMLNSLLILMSLLSVFTGFGVSNVPLVASKVPFIWGFPHKWNGLLLFLVSILSFVIFWFKGQEVGRKGLLLAVVGLLLVAFQLFTGWMMKLVFFS